MAEEEAVAEVEIDNFSRLPDKLVMFIVSLLPSKAAAITSVLSTRWRNLYAFYSTLDFDFYVDCIGSTDVVDIVFSLGNTLCPIDKFSVNSSASQSFDSSRFEVWMRAVLQRGVRELDLSLSGSLKLPTILFTCKTLVVFNLDSKLSDSGLEVPTDVYLPSLKVLSVVNAISFSKDDSAKRLYSSCPVLEQLVIVSYLCEEGDCKSKLNVSSTTIKRLTVQTMADAEQCDAFEIEINAPNLVYFKYYGWEGDTFAFSNVQSLVEADIDFRNVSGDSSTYLNAANVLIGGISNVQTLRISVQTMLHLNKELAPIPVLQNVTNLSVFEDEFSSWDGLPSFLTHCDSLKTLVLEFNADLTDDDSGPPCEWDPNAWLIIKESKVSCLLSSLKDIEIRSFVADEIQFNMIEYFLKGAGALENMKIQNLELVKYEDQLGVIAQLLLLPRSSEICSVII